MTTGFASPDYFEANGWNPNVMDEFMLAKARESITEYGFIDPVTVRVADDPDRFQVIDGEHRVMIAKEMGLPEIPYVLIDADDAKAMKLTVVLNELRGRYDPRKMSDLLSDLLADDGSMEALAVALPFQPEALKGMVGLKDFDWGTLDPTAPASGPAPSNKGERWVERMFRIPPDANEIVGEALARMKRLAPGIDDGKALELICAEFLAGS